jgi:hypothetical protein
MPPHHRRATIWIAKHDSCGKLSLVLASAEPAADYWSRPLIRRKQSLAEQSKPFDDSAERRVRSCRQIRGKAVGFFPDVYLMANGRKEIDFFHKIIPRTNTGKILSQMSKSR